MYLDGDERHAETAQDLEALLPRGGRREPAHEG
jgi:hypothetical protein